ncbi:MAG: hypothetical protein RL721_1922, partial [Candidatus Eisenbacteria bacterium]
MYRATLAWDEPWFRLNGFFREGHYHWGYEGDFFNLYREAYYGPNIDIYNADVPLGVEIVGKKGLNGLTFAFGPELWWGANPAMLAKYRRQLGRFQTTGVVQVDVAEKQISVFDETSASIPLP